MPRTHLSILSRNSALASFLFVFGLVAIVYWPESEIAVTNSCAPDGVIARARAFAQGEHFWTAQVEKLNARIQSLERQPEIDAAIDAAIQRSNVEIEAINSKYAHLRPPRSSPSQVAADALRKAANDIERAERQASINRLTTESIQILRVCRDAIVVRLR